MNSQYAYRFKYARLTAIQKKFTDRNPYYRLYFIKN